MGSTGNIDELILAYLRGDIGQDDLKKLSDLLVTDPVARQRFTLLARQEVQIRDVFRAAGQETISRDGGVKTMKFPVARVLAAAAVLAVCVGAYFMLSKGGGSGKGEVVARVAGVNGVVYATAGGGAPRQVRMGDTITAGTILESKSGAAVQVTSVEGDAIDLDANTRFCFEGAGSQRRLTLSRGNLYCAVNKRVSGQQFEIVTESGHRVVAMGTVFEMKTSGGKTTVAVEDGTVLLHTATGRMELGILQTASAQGNEIGESKDIMLHELAAWKFRQAEIPAGTVLFSDDFNNGISKWRFADIGGELSENQGISNSRCLRLSLKKVPDPAKCYGYVSPDLMARHRDFDVSLKFRWTGKDDGRLGPLLGLANSKEADFSWFNRPAKGQTQGATAERRRERSLRRVSENTWYDVVYEWRGMDCAFKVYDKGDLCYERVVSHVTPYRWVGLVFKCLPDARPESAYLDDVVIRKAKTTP